MRLRFALVAAASVAARLVAAGSSIDRIEPPGGAPGSELEIRITGNDLNSPAELFFEDRRIEVLSLEPDGEKAAKATLRIPSDCPLGGHRVRVRTADGLSELRHFHVHPHPQTREVEPNDSPAVAMPVAAGSTIWGTVKNEEFDLFKVNAKAGQRISAVVDAVRLDQQMLDAHLELVDAEGFVVAACDDHPLTAQDPMLSVIVPKDGDYFLRLREAAYGGGDAIYMLHVGSFPIPHVAWPPGGVEGATFEAELVGDPGGPQKRSLTLPPAGLDGLARVRLVHEGLPTPVVLPFRATKGVVHVVNEPNDEPDAVAAEKTPSLKPPLAVVGRLEASSDVDWVRFEAAAGSKWRVAGHGRRLGSPIDLVVAAHRDDKSRARITSNDDANGPDSLLEVTVPAEGAFFLRVSDFERRGGEGFLYWIDVESIPPAANVSVSPATTKTQERLVVAVPRGGRTACFFNAIRAACPEPLRVEFAGLPEGVTAVAPPFTEPASGGVVVFEASSEAVPRTSMVDVSVMRGEGAAAARVGGLRQVTDLVFGEPNRATYRSTLCDRLAVAVVEETPVSVELVEPAAPVVQGGLANLVVRVERPGEFDGKVRLELPFKPPGIGAGSVDVPSAKLGPGATDVSIPITVARDAAVRDWPIAVTAMLMPDEEAMKKGQKDDKQARKRRGRFVVVSSRPATLSVAAPMVELAAEKAVVEQGGETTIVFKVTKKGVFEGKAKASLVGLPSRAESQERELSANDDSLEFVVKAGGDALPGKYEPVVCRLELTVAGGTVVHQSQPTSLRIDKPLRAVAQAKPGETRAP